MRGPPKKPNRMYMSKVLTNTSHPHMVYTEAQNLDEALNIISHKQIMRKRSHKKIDARVDKELGPKKPITLPQLKFMEKKSWEI